MNAISKLSVPKNYFNGRRVHQICRADNLLFFVREHAEILHQSNFESRPHHRYVLLVNFETAGSINVDGSVYRLEPGDAFIVAPYQFHFYMNVDAESIRWLFITFESQNNKSYLPFLNTPVKLGKSEIEDTLQLSKSYSAIKRRDETGTNIFILKVELLINRIKALADKQTSTLIRAIAKTDSSYALVESINAILAVQLEAGLGIKSLATQLSISESHLRKRFRQLTGLSLGSYLVHFKLNRAVKLLVHSSESLTAISVLCGYESLAAFSRSFRNRLGTSPSEYRSTASKR